MLHEVSMEAAVLRQSGEFAWAQVLVLTAERDQAKHDVQDQH